MSTITPDENIDPVLRERSSPASLSPTKQNNGEFISKADFSAQMYVHSQSVPESNSDARRAVPRSLENNRSSMN
jgi:hypothetical protein